MSKQALKTNSMLEAIRRDTSREGGQGGPVLVGYLELRDDETVRIYSDLALARYVECSLGDVVDAAEVEMQGHDKNVVRLRPSALVRVVHEGSAEDVHPLRGISLDPGDPFNCDRYADAIRDLEAGIAKLAKNPNAPPGSVALLQDLLSTLRWKYWECEHRNLDYILGSYPILY